MQPIGAFGVLDAGMGSVMVMIVSLVVIILMITKGKINPVYAMLVGALGAGIAFGIPIANVVPIVLSGFGTTIGNIGIVILLGCTIGVILEQTGGALVLANTILRAVGKRNAPLAMMLSGYLISIPVFSDTAIVIMSPVARTVSARSGVALIACLGALNAGIMATHTIVPPTPGPLAAAGTLGVDLGMMIALGSIVALAYGIAAVLWCSSKICVSRFPNPAVVEGIEPLKSGKLTAEDLTIKSDKPLPGAPITQQFYI
ncbi:MAG: SLC13 family permease [Spirochaetes bacterium]|nr:SLC13 family permease [Spirochaetota bacterium]